MLCSIIAATTTEVMCVMMAMPCSRPCHSTKLKSAAEKRGVYNKKYAGVQGKGTVARYVAIVELLENSAVQMKLLTRALWRVGYNIQEGDGKETKNW